MVAFQEGDDEAFAALYDRHQRMLINFFYKMCYDRALAEDLTQEAFLRLIRHRGRYRPEATFRTYLYTVARNLLIDRHRSRKAAPRTVSADLRIQEDGATIGDLVESRQETIEKRVADREAVELVREALETLPEAQRDVYVLAEAQGLKYREVAEVLGIPVGTVKSRMNAAVTRLRGMLGHILG
ncbi:MAG: RNA polymerase sigma factor [Planctomycetota bacterium]|jgi:RNA polymerase sigma-70 factor (ECF subfamily)